MTKAKTFALLSPAFAPILTAATTFEPDPLALAGAEWDIFTSESATPATVSQGSANSTFGALVTSSELTTEILIGYDSPPGGLGFTSDTYYLHNGASTWSSNLLLSSDVSFVRVSYSLLSSPFGPLAPFGIGPNIAGATLLESGSYAVDGAVIFYSNLALAAPSNTIDASFGDQTVPFFVPAFRSIDAIQVEVFDTEPTAIPEPSAGLMVLLGACCFLRRKR